MNHCRSKEPDVQISVTMLVPKNLLTEVGDAKRVDLGTSFESSLYKTIG